jgi:hypothetical protein
VNDKTKIKYVHLREIDQFLTVRGLESLGKVRKTIDEKTGLPKSCIVKKRIANLEVLMPESNLDYRISVNLEMQLVDQDQLEGYASHSRKKDRLSYSLKPFQVDLTQVTNIGVA